MERGFTVTALQLRQQCLLYKCASCCTTFYWLSSSFKHTAAIHVNFSSLRFVSVNVPCAKLTVQMELNTKTSVLKYQLRTLAWLFFLDCDRFLIIVFFLFDHVLDLQFWIHFYNQDEEISYFPCILPQKPSGLFKCLILINYFSVCNTLT